MKISYADYIKKTDVSVLVAEVIFSELEIKYPIKFISEVVNTASGGTPTRGNVEYYNGDIPWLKSGELNDAIIENAEEYITKKGLANSSAKLHPKNTLLLAMYGATAGRTGITKMEVSTNQAVCALFPKENVTLEYLFWFLRQYRYKFIEISKGGAQPNISQLVINLTKIPVPDIALQNQISDTLTKIENEGLLDISIIPKAFREKVTRVFTSKNNVFEIDIELHNQLSLVKKLRQQLLQDAVQAKLVEQNPNDIPASVLLRTMKAEKEQLIKEKKLKTEKELPSINETEIPFKIPSNWQWCRLGDLGSFRRGPFGSALTKGIFVKEGYKVYEQRNAIYDNHSLGNYYITQEKFRELKAFQVFPKDLIVSCSGTLGRIAEIPEGAKDGIMNQALMRITLFNSAILNSFFILLFRSPYIQQNIFEQAWGTAMSNMVGLVEIKKILIPLPPIEEQYQIVMKLEYLLQTCKDLDDCIKKSSVQNNKLLQQVLREALQTQ